MRELIRERVEVILIDSDNVLMIETNYDGKPVLHFPGGGLEGDNINMAAAKECAEEVGVSCYPLVVLDYEESADSFGSGYKAWRKEIYDKVRTRFVVARIQSMDDSVLGTDGDSERFLLINIHDAIDRIQSSLEYDKIKFPVDRIYVLKQALEYI